MHVTHGQGDAAKHKSGDYRAGYAGAPELH